MRILYLESSGSWGGQEFRTCREINWLNANGHKAWLICDPASQVFTKARELGTRVRPMPLRWRISPLRTWRLWQFCREHRIQLVKTFGSKDQWLCLPLYLAGMPVIRARCITNSLGKRNRGFIYKHGCAKIVADAQVIKRQLIEEDGIDPAKIEVVGSGVDLTRFNPSQDRMKFRNELGIAPETPLIVNVGMIRSDKGQATLIAASRFVLRQRPDARFVVVGEATRHRGREQRIRRKLWRAGVQDKVWLMGYRWDTPEILAAADMVVIASFGTEASPIVLREAMATGRPLIATKVGDVPEIIQHGENGLLAEPGSPDSLASAILLFLSDTDLARRCAQNGLTFARKHFCFDRMMRAKLRIDEMLVRDVDVGERLRSEPAEFRPTPD